MDTDMAHNYSLQEVTRRSINLTKYEEVYIIWCDSYLTVQADKTVHIFELAHNLECIDKKINCLEYAIKVPESSPATGLFKQLGCVRGMDLVQMTMDPGLWPHSKYLLHEICDITALEWSPGRLLWNNDYVLSVLNNVGHVEFYRKARKTWAVALKLSTLIKKHFKEAANTCSNNINIIRKCAYALETSAMCWAPFANEDNTAYFVTAQKNGTYLLWLINDEEETLKAECVSQIDTEFTDIIKILWIPKGSKVLMLCSNILGQIFMLEFSCSDKRFALQNSYMLWSHKDKMIMRYCNYVIVENKIILICNKHRHLIIQMLSEDCRVLSQNTKNINDYKITGISKYENSFFATLINGSMYQIKYSINNDDTLNLEYNVINNKDINSSHEFHSSSFSRNGALLALAIVDRKVLYRKDHLKIDIIYYTVADTDFYEFMLLLNNPTRKLTHYWDCIETLRYKIVKSRKLPEYDYQQLLLEGETDIYKLKLYFIILRVYSVLEENFKVNRNTLPESSKELIKEKIAKSHAKVMIQNLYERFLSHNKTFTDFEAECFAGGKKYLEIMSKKHKTNIDIPIEVLNLNNKDFNYICQCCDKVIKGYSCEEGHLNAYCSVTFTPIENDDYLICKGCGATARSELTKEKPMCIYCDLYFEHIYQYF